LVQSGSDTGYPDDRFRPCRALQEVLGLAREHGVATEPYDLHIAKHVPCRRGRERRNQSLSLLYVSLYRRLLFLPPPRLSLPGTLHVLVGLLDLSEQRRTQ
jgi:hypothetical protein